MAPFRRSSVTSVYSSSALPLFIVVSMALAWRAAITGGLVWKSSRYPAPPGVLRTVRDVPPGGGMQGKAACHWGGIVRPSYGRRAAVLWESDLPHTKSSGCPVTGVVSRSGQYGCVHSCPPGNSARREMYEMVRFCQCPLWLEGPPLCPGRADGDLYKGGSIPPPIPAGHAGGGGGG